MPSDKTLLRYFGQYATPAPFFTISGRGRSSTERNS